MTYAGLRGASVRAGAEDTGYESAGRHARSRLHSAARPVYALGMSSDASSILARDFDEPKLEALIETMFLAAYADGEFGDDERDHFVKSVESLTDRRLEGGKLEQLLTKVLAEVE